MPTIKPFRGIRPGPDHAEQVVLNLENLSLEEARSIRDANPLSYVNMLVPKLDHHFLMGSRNELIFKKISENFEDFIDKGVLVRDSEPSIYVYRVSTGDLIQTGIWTLTSIDDYLNNVVRKHELTRHDREQALINYLQQTGIDANPVLITYHPEKKIADFIVEKTLRAHDLHFAKEGVSHKIWKISEPDELEMLVNAFREIPVTYIADGHHRAAAASLLGIERRKLNLKHRGKEEYNFFTSVYMAADQLKILEFNRLVKDLNGHNTLDFLKLLAVDFEIAVQGFEFRPSQPKHFGMYLEGQWFELRLKTPASNPDNPVDALDVSILQDKILSPLLNIADPRTDSRIAFFGGITPLSELEEKVNKQEYAVAFVLHPTSAEELFSVADAGEVMPPKSTWFEPKFQVGMLIHQFD